MYLLCTYSQRDVGMVVNSYPCKEAKLIIVSLWTQSCLDFTVGGGHVQAQTHMHN